MIVETNGVAYRTKYFPFFKIRESSDFDVYSMRLPSGISEEVLILDKENYYEALKEYLSYCIKEFVLEDDLMLTSKALCIKKDLIELLEIIDDR